MPGINPNPPPSSQMVDIEVLMGGIVAAGGSTSRLSDFVFHFRRQNPALPNSTKAQIEGAFQTAIAVPICAALNARFIQSNTRIRFLNWAGDAYAVFSRNVVGSIAGDSMSTVVAAFILAQTGLRGRSFLAKKHLFPLSESDTTAGADDILNAGAVARFNTIKAAWLAGFTDVSGNVWVPTCFSRFLSTYRTDPTNIVAPQITATLLNKRLGTMKHRRVASDY
jgi:hypothetical protein